MRSCWRVPNQILVRHSPQRYQMIRIGQVVYVCSASDLLKERRQNFDQQIDNFDRLKCREKDL